MSQDYEDVKVIRQRIESGLAARAPHDKVWAEITRAYRGDSTGGNSTGDDVHINYLLSIANAMLPTLTGGEPVPKVRPRTPSQVGQCRGAEKSLGYIWRRIGAQETYRSLALDAMLYSLSVAKTGWNDYEDGQTVAPVDNSRAYSDLPDLPEKTVDRLTEAGIPLSVDLELPFYRRVAPWDFVLPPGVEGLADSTWVAERLVLHETEVRAVDWWDLPADYSPDTHLDPLPSPGGTSLLGSVLDAVSNPDYTAEYSVVYEYHTWVYDNGVRKRRVTHLLWKDDADPHVLASADSGSAEAGWPYDTIKFATTTGGVYASKMSELGSVMDICTRLNEEWSLILKHHRVNQRRKLVVSSAMNDDEIRDWLESDEDMAVLHTNMENVNMAVFVVPEAPPPSDTTLVLEGLTRAMNEVSGMDAIQRGSIPKQATATASSIANANTQARLSLRVSRLEAHVARVGQKLLNLSRQFLSRPLVIRLTDDENPEWMTFDMRELQGEFDLVVEPGSTMARDPSSRTENLIQMLGGMSAVVTTLMPAVQAGLVDVQVVKKFIDEVLAIWHRDPQSFDGPFAAALSKAAPSGGALTGPTTDTDNGVSEAPLASDQLQFPMLGGE